MSFQAAYRYKKAYYSSQMRVQATKNPSVTVEAVTKADVQVKIRKVGFVPSAYPAYGENDVDYLTTEPGLFPDPLEELTGSFQLIPFYWRSLWIDLQVGDQAKAGNYDVELYMRDFQGNILKKISVCLHIVACRLPKQRLIHTEWFHSDCLADYYHVPVFSQQFWEIVENFMRVAVRRGVNMILTPLFTLPLDTLIGKERTTVQLVGVTVKKGSYQFDFTEFEHWIHLSKECGFEYFEMSHLFSQWGAKYAPKVVAKVDGQENKIFGWDTRADGAAYQDFLHRFLPALIGKLRELGIADKTYFHISDEPNQDNIDTFRTASELVKEELKGFPVLDALSTPQYYEEGLVSCPVPTNEHIHEFLDIGMEHPWVYYCSGEYMEVSNRFFAQPSSRNRILGVQLYLYKIEGFLHWGYNYYNSQYSIRKINPYIVTDADDAFPSGDSFLVYPGENGEAVESLRLLVLEEGLNDCRALELLESYKGREYVENLIEKTAGMRSTFSEFPRNSAFLLRLRKPDRGQTRVRFRSPLFHEKLIFEIFRKRLAIEERVSYNLILSESNCLVMIKMDGFPSGQRGQTVNLLQIASVVRIHLHPLRERCIRSEDFFLAYM